MVELLVGLGFENEAMAARGRIEGSRRCVEKCEQRIDFNESLFNEITAPANLKRLLEEQQLQQIDNNRS
jgi:hypothetical protein